MMVGDRNGRASRKGYRGAGGGRARSGRRPLAELQGDSSRSSPIASSRGRSPSACFRPCGGTTRSRSSFSSPSSASCPRSTLRTTPTSSSASTCARRSRSSRRIARDIERTLGESDAIGQIMLATALEYRDVVRMLAARGTPAFYEWSRKLYGSPKDKFPDGRSTVRDLGQLLYGLLTNVDEWSDGSLGRGLRLVRPAGRTFRSSTRDLDATEAARRLGERLARFFGDTRVSVEADDGILADAAAGSDYVKVRNGAKFSAARHRHPRGARGLGARRHVAQRPGAARGQVAREGAAADGGRAGRAGGAARDVHVPHVPAARATAQRSRPRGRQGRGRRELPRRVRVVPDRGLRRRGVLPQHAPRLPRRGARAAARPSRRTPATARASSSTTRSSAAPSSTTASTSFPFSSWARSPTRTCRSSRVASRTGWSSPPRYLPPMFRDLNGLAIWMAYSTFFSQLGGDAIADHYARVFARAS